MTKFFSQVKPETTELEIEIKKREEWDAQFRRHVQDPYGEALLKDTKDPLPMIADPVALY